MTDNPYQSPASHVSRAQDMGPMEGTGTFTIGRSFSGACDATIGSLGLVLGAMLTCFLIYLISSATVIGYLIFMPVLGWGVIRFGLNLIDGHAQFEDLFSGFTNYGSRLGRMLFLGLVMVLIGFMASVPFYFGLYTGNWIVLGMGWLFSMVVMGLIVARLYFAAIYMVDQNMGCWSRFKLHWRPPEKYGCLRLAWRSLREL